MFVISRMGKSIDFSCGRRGVFAGRRLNVVGASMGDRRLARGVVVCDNAGMNREEATAELGISVRSLQRAVQAGKIGVTYKRGASGNQEAHYDDGEVARYKATMETETVKPAVASTGLLAVASMDDTSLARSVALIARETTVEVLKRVKGVRPGVPIGFKLTLNLDEAAMLAGLSRGFLREAIRDGKLKASIIGRGWRVKRSDLESYIKKL